VLGGISATRHATATATDPSEGWWQDQVGPGAAIDTTRYQVLGVDWHVPDSGVVTTLDQARAIADVLGRLGIARLEAIVGSSYGGMVALSFASAFPERVGRLVLIAAAHESHPFATAQRVIQRRIIRLALAGGLPTEGLALARALAITTYRTAAEFAERFPLEPDAPFAVERYLDRAAVRFVERCTPERYLALSESLDLHRVDPATVRTPTALLGVREDTLVPCWQLWQLQAQLGAPCSLEEISSLTGHDAFLTEPELVRDFLERALAAEVRRAA
jgi:homoserine O-acetyltransferase